MHSSVYAKLAQEADEQSNVIVALVERAHPVGESPNGAVVLWNPDSHTYRFTQYGINADGLHFSVFFFAGRYDMTLARAMDVLAEYVEQQSREATNRSSGDIEHCHTLTAIPPASLSVVV
jgi:hypothetical protein